MAKNNRIGLHRQIRQDEIDSALLASMKRTIAEGRSREGVPGWTHTPPTEPGYYWMREPQDSGTAHIVELQPDGWIMRIGSDVADDPRDGPFEFWPEPIAPPKE